MSPARLFVFMGALLCASGVAQVFVRPRGMMEKPLQRILNASTIRAFVFVCVGLTGILFGLGLLPIKPR